MKVQTGYLFIADITGYTQFLTQSELQHAAEILESLFDTMLTDLEPPLKILNTRGDAVFAYATAHSFRQAHTLLDTMDKIYFDFKRQLEFMGFNTTCQCNACANMSSLDLKIFLHYGDYLVHELGGVAELQGSDVILVNRLMKNSVKEKTGLNGYGLVTEAAVQAMEAADLTDHMIRHLESYEHLGQVPVRIHDLQAEWRQQRKMRRKALTLEDAWVAATATVPVLPWTAWDMATDLKAKTRYFDMLTIVRTDAEGGRYNIGSSFHCCHRTGDLFYTVVDWNPPLYFTADISTFGLKLLFTLRVSPIAEGSTVEIIFGRPYEGDYEPLTNAFQELVQGAANRYAELVEEEIAEGRIDSPLLVPSN